MPGGIERIALKRFRGATTTTDLALDPSKRVVLIFGENGTGKSTLVDALDLILNQNIGSLGDRSSASTKHLPAIGHGLKDLAVKIVCGGETWIGAYSGSKLQVRGAATCPPTHVLRRRQLIDLTEAAPAARYEKLRRFIDVEPVERCEEGLKRAVTAAEARLNEAVRQKVSAEQDLTALWTLEGCPGGESEGPLAWAARKSGADLSATREKGRWLQSFLEALVAAEQRRASWEAAREAATGRIASLAEVETQIAEAARQNPSNDLGLLDLLRQVKGLIARPETLDHCPVCRQAVDGATLGREVDRRIASLATMAELADRREQAARAVELAVAQRERAEREWEAAARSLAERTWGLGRWFPEWAAPEEESAADAPGSPDEPSLVALSSLVDLLAEQRPELERHLEDARSDVAQYNAIRQHHEGIRAADSALAELDLVLQRLKQALEIARRQRIAFTQSVLGRITEECNRLYGCLHPEEGLGLSHFQLDEKRRASVQQGAHFLGHTDVPPQAYFSESHLDTLAFCLFLALAKEYGVRILILDDVFTSVDQAHLGRVMDLLIAESAHFDQILMTTHYRPWRDQYKLKANGGAALQLIELEPWEQEHGIRWHEGDPTVVSDPRSG
jgi:energy-coupling factor transporter ATP-binding protein EcfA2